METYQAAITVVGSILTMLVASQTWVIRSLFKRMCEQQDSRDNQFAAVTKSLQQAIDQARIQADLMNRALQQFETYEREEDVVHDKIIAHMTSQGVALDKIANALGVVSQKMDVMLTQIQRELDNLRRDLAKNPKE